jgi:hypothetical protein
VRVNRLASSSYRRAVRGRRGAELVLLVTLACAALALVLASTAGAMSQTRRLQAGMRVQFRGITCAAKKEHKVLVCYSRTLPYEVTIGRASVTVAKAGGGKVVFAVPGPTSPRSTPSTTGAVIVLKKGAHIVYDDIQCITREANYNIVACIGGSNRYDVSIGMNQVVVTQDTNGHVLYLSQ